MGKGPSIEELAEREETFRNYLKQIRTELEADKNSDILKLEELIEKYYTDGGWEYKPLMLLDNVDVQQVSSWSLDNVVKIITSVKDAIFGDSTPPEGVEIEKPESWSNSIGELNKLNLLAVNRAFEAIQGILQTFATESSYRGKSITKVELVAPGMTVFISIRSDIWRSQGFFNNESIAQYMFIVRSFFSLEQAGDISKYNDLLAYEELKASFRTRMLALAKVIADPETEYSALIELEEELGHYSEQIGKIQAMIDELQQDEINKSLSIARMSIERRIKEVKRNTSA